jgi:hypothetical protein
MTVTGMHNTASTQYTQNLPNTSTSVSKIRTQCVAAKQASGQKIVCLRPTAWDITESFVPFAHVKLSGRENIILLHMDGMLNEKIAESILVHLHARFGSSFVALDAMHIKTLV